MPSWESLVRERGPVLLRSAWRVLRDVQEAEDVAQDVLLELYRSRRPPQAVDPPLLRCMAVRRAVDRLRRRKAFAPMEGSSLADPATSPEAQAIAREMVDRLQLAVSQLPPRQAEVFCLRFLHDMGYDQIAAGLGITRDAVAVALHEARNRLRIYLGDLLEEARS